MYTVWFSELFEYSIACVYESYYSLQKCYNATDSLCLTTQTAFPPTIRVGHCSFFFFNDQEVVALLFGILLYTSLKV